MLRAAMRSLPASPVHFQILVTTLVARDAVAASGGMPFPIAVNG
jgi:hypothetical protein